jgi:partner of Y14 and mago protein
LRSVRKQLKVRPGFTPQEDVQRFRGTRQAQLDANALPKGHIVGWAPPSDTIQIKVAQSQSARKNAKRKEKRKEKKDEELQKKVADSWEDDDDEPQMPAGKKDKAKEGTLDEEKEVGPSAKKDDATDVLAEKLDKLAVH